MLGCGTADQTYPVSACSEVASSMPPAMAKHLDTHGGPRYSGAVFGLFYREDIYNRKVLSFNQQGGV